MRKIIDRVFIYALCVILLLTLGMSFQSSHKLSSNTPSHSSNQNFPTGLMMNFPLTQQSITLSNPVTPIPAVKNSKQASINEPAPEKTKSAVTIVPEIRIHTYVVTAFYLNVRENPNSKSNINDVVKKGDLLEVAQVTENGWLELQNGGYVHGDYAEVASGADEAGKRLNKPASLILALPDITLNAGGQPEPAKPTSIVKSDSGLHKEHIAAIFEGTDLANHELEEVILEIEEEYGINAYFTIAVMKLESGNGSSRLAKRKNNLFGLNAIDGDKHDRAFSFNTKGDSIRKFGQLLSKNYVGKGYTTIEKVATKYCPANSKWSSLVKTIMNRDYKKL